MSFSRDGQVLTGRAAPFDVCSWKSKASCCSPVEAGDIAEMFGLWPVVLEDLRSELVFFTVAYYLEAGSPER